jgi:RNA polymerase sigma-70 factor (ECF subfamily)
MNKSLEEEKDLNDLESIRSEKSDDDSRLVALFRDGDRIAFDRLVLKYQKQILALCIRMLGNQSDGEDMAQETFVKVYTSIGQFKGYSQFSTWLYTIAINTCRNSGQSWWNRMWKKSLKLDKPVIGKDGEEITPELSDTRMLPSKELEKKRRSILIENAINKLPVIHKELVLLRDFHEKSYEEIEMITGVTQGTIKSRLARARAALQEELKGVLDE